MAGKFLSTPLVNTGIDSPWGQFLNSPAWKATTSKSNNSDILGIGIWAAAIPPALYGAGSIMKSAGKGIYWLTFPKSKQEAEAIQNYKAGLSKTKPTTTVQTAVESGILPKIKQIQNNPLNALMPNMAGGKEKIGIDAKIWADQLWKKVVWPALEKSQSKVNIPSIFDKMAESIKASKVGELRKSELLEGLDALREDYRTIGVDTLDMMWAQNEKSTLREFLPQKMFKWKDVASSYNQVKWMFADELQNITQDTISKESGINAAKEYRNYANFKKIADEGATEMTKARFRAGFGNLVSTVVDKITTPFTTTAGKGMYKLGELAQIPQKAINKWLTIVGKNLKNVPKALKWSVKSWNLPSMILSILAWWDSNLPENVATDAYFTAAKYRSNPDDFVKVNYQWEDYIISKDAFQDVQGMKLFQLYDGTYIDMQGRQVN